VDEAPVWSISCFYVRVGYRKQGLEAYPLDADSTTSTSFTGYATAFARVGFKTVACHVPSRPIMRHDLKAIL
jgi:hypothetical protein